MRLSSWNKWDFGVSWWSWGSQTNPKYVLERFRVNNHRWQILVRYCKVFYSERGLRITFPQHGEIHIWAFKFNKIHCYKVWCNLMATSDGQLEPAPMHLRHVWWRTKPNPHPAFGNIAPSCDVLHHSHGRLLWKLEFLVEVLMYFLWDGLHPNRNLEELLI